MTVMVDYYRNDRFAIRFNFVNVIAGGVIIRINIFAAPTRLGLK